MQWRGRRQSGNIEDRRSEGGGFGGGLGRGGPFGGRGPFGGGGGPFGGGGGPFGGMGPRTRFGGGLGIMVVVVLIILFSGNFFGDKTQQPGVNNPAITGGATGGTAGSDAARDFVAVVLADTEDVWNAKFKAIGAQYEEPALVLFSGAIESACGYAQSASGPFYCPGDHKVYIDLSFFEELATRFGAPGDFAQAYVIAHEVGHHVQNLMGVMAKVDNLRSGLDRTEQNALSVKVELQADCLAGVWAHDTQAAKGVIEAGDIEEALGAASGVGDDRIQKQTQGRVVPDAFTHGSAEQRMRWFSSGFKSGDIKACDTFTAAQL